ncbi:MAG: class F sortase [Dehalococcoidia bacterium]
MKRRAFLGLAGLFLLPACDDSPVIARPSATPTATTQPTAVPAQLIPTVARRQPAIAPVYLPPVRLRMPRIGVDTPVKEVGLDTAGELVVPTTGEYAVWYGGSPPPGLTGNAILAGHVDWGGKIAVFFRLKELGPGDQIETVAADGALRRFVVTSNTAYEPAKAPLDRIYGPTSHPAVTLITCGGVFLSDRRDYSLRIVVRGELTDR